MAIFRKKLNPRRRQVRDDRAAQRASMMSRFVEQGYLNATFTGLVFALLCSFVLSLELSDTSIGLCSAQVYFAYLFLSLLITAGIAIYTYLYQPKILHKQPRLFALSGLLFLMLALAKFLSWSQEWAFLTTGTAITCAMIIAITYNQRYSLNISILYSLLASFVLSGKEIVELYMLMVVGIFAFCFMLQEIRNRWKIIQVSMIASMCVFATSVSIGVIDASGSLEILQKSGTAAISTFFVGVIIQGILPVIEKLFGVVTSMTLMDYSDANQPLLRKIAMEAPGTYSHSLLLGSLAEKAAEAIGANGLLCRVGAYYHDIGKVNKPDYFVENQMGQSNRHDNITPAMSQLVIVGHVKDGIEIAKEYGLPEEIRQFIETHHGTTVIKYFYEEAKKRAAEGSVVNEDNFRYPGPRPSTKEAAILMLCDGTEGAVRALSEPTAPRIKTIVHNIAMARLQDGQFDNCEITIQDISRIEEAVVKVLAAHYHNRIKYPESEKPAKQGNKNGTNGHNFSGGQTAQQ
jgi:putative nucleotidyltransferase with HDIG domain